LNYFEHHIGDYDKNTAHLTACEDGIYHRLLRRYYDKERPLDADPNEVKRIARARTREEKSAVDAVLREFFHLEADGWHHDKCDEVIAIFQAGEPEREAKKKNEDTRLARHRAERAELFAVINGAGQHMSWNAPMGELRAAVERIKNGTATPDSRSPATLPATAPATPATATHTPNTTPHTPDTRGNSYATSNEVAGARPSDEPPELDLAGEKPKAIEPPDCPHLEVLSLWAEVLPALPQHDPEHWNATRAAHLRARWRETAVAKRWADKADGLTYFRKFFGYVGKSPYLTGRVPPRDQNRQPFVIELAWLVKPDNWAKVHEGKYHQEAA
jgi:uncharacterized protein YdaU (DUF1376 family)